MKDRIPKYPGRVKMTHVSGDLYDMVRADEPVEEGTPLNKATLLTDETAAMLGLDPATDPTVDDALQLIAEKPSVLYGSTVPTASQGKDGDIYVKTR